LVGIPHLFLVDFPVLRHLFSGILVQWWWWMVCYRLGILWRVAGALGQKQQIGPFVYFALDRGFAGMICTCTVESLAILSLISSGRATGRLRDLMSWRRTSRLQYTGICLCSATKPLPSWENKLLSYLIDIVWRKGSSSSWSGMGGHDHWARET